MAKVTPHLIFVLTLLLTTLAAKGDDVAAFEPQPAIQFVPADPVEYLPIHSVAGVGVDAGKTAVRRCAMCSCCASNDTTNCQVMRCCFLVKCRLPGPLIETCILVPEACNCTSCK